MGARRRHEDGYSLVEVVTVVVILGIIAVPLSRTLVQAINFGPQSGQRTQTATDDSRLLDTFSADVAQAQRIDTYTPASGVGTGTGALNLDTSTNPWTANPTSTTFKCQTGPAVDFIKMTWRDRTQDAVDANGNVVPPLPPSSSATYSLAFTAVAGSSPALNVLDLRRVGVLRGGAPSAPVSYLQRVYCTPGDTVVAVNVVPANSVTDNEEVSIAVKSLKDRTGKLIQMSGAAAGAIEVHGTARVES